MRFKKITISLIISIFIVCSFLAGFFINYKRNININDLEQRIINFDQEIKKLKNKLNQVKKSPKPVALTQKSPELNQESDLKLIEYKGDFEGYENTIRDLKTKLKYQEDKNNEVIKLKEQQINKINQQIIAERGYSFELTQIIKQLQEEQNRLRKQIDINKINLKDFESSFFIKQLFVSQSQVDKKTNEIFASEIDILKVLKPIILKQLKHEVDSSLSLSDFRVIFDPKYSKSGLTYIELSAPKIILIKIAGVNKAKQETKWLELHLPKAIIQN